MSCSSQIESSNLQVQGVTRKIIGEGGSVYLFGSESSSELIYLGKKNLTIFFSIGLHNPSVTKGHGYPHRIPGGGATPQVSHDSLDLEA